MTAFPADPAPRARACVCYVVDEGYLFPTLVSAIQARRFTSVDMAEVVIACIGPPTAIGDRVREIAREHGVLFISVPAEVIDGMDAMFGRLFVDRFLPPRFERILYIDGDTQVAGSLDPLFKIDIEPGCFLACRDPASLFADLSPARQARLAEYRQGLGLSGPVADYFNSGVLVLQREGWAAMAQACLDAYAERQAAFRYADQDALNLAVGDRCRLISNKWNFPGFLIGSAADKARRPHIYHFMSNPRPWKVVVGPWGGRWSKPYAKLLREHPELHAIAPRRRLVDQLRYMLQQQVKIWFEYRRVGRRAVIEPPLQGV